MTDFDLTQYSEEPAAVDAAGDAPAKPLSWYQRNKARVCEEYKRAYADNRDGFKDKKLVSGNASYERNKHKRPPKTEEQITQIKARQKRWYEANKEKQKVRERARYQEKKDYNTSVRLQSKFGITLDEYNAMLALQRGLCAVCGSEPNIKDKNGNIRRLAVDHDHKTGKVRQLLCNACNTSIGLVKENVSTLVNMIDYIKKHETGEMKKITIEFTLDEVQALAGLIDAGVKATGIQSVKAAAVLIAKLEAAVAEANAKTQETE
jgi:hypothetical protein